MHLMDRNALVGGDEAISVAFATNCAPSRTSIALGATPDRAAKRRTSARRTRRLIRSLIRRQRAFAYSAALIGMVTALVVLSPDPVTSTDAAYAPMGIALIVGALLGLRLKPGDSGSSLLL